MDDEHLRSIYDTEDDNEDLWFEAEHELEAEECAPDTLRPKAAKTNFLEPVDWISAEASLSKEVCALSFDLGRLCETVNRLGKPSADYLAIHEAAALSWWAGDRISVEKIALFQALRIGSVGKDNDSMRYASWAARRLMARPSALTSFKDQIGANLGYRSESAMAICVDFSGVVPQPHLLSSITLGCAVFHGFKVLEERPYPIRYYEAGVLGARIAMPQISNSLGFMPVGLTGATAYSANGSPYDKLTAWIKGAHNATLAALMKLANLEIWKKHADNEVSDLSGRSPSIIIALFFTYPTLAINQIHLETGISLASCHRNLALLEQRGLIRELTGHSRFRVWAANI